MAPSKSLYQPKSFNCKGSILKFVNDSRPSLLGWNLFVFLLAFLSIGALYGGGAFTLKPDGSLSQISLSPLDASPFNDCLISGIILFGTFGLMSLLLIWALLKKPQGAWLGKRSPFSDYYFGKTYTVYTGIALIIWIAVQTRIFPAVDRLHTIYTFYGIAIIVLALLPSKPKLYILKEKE